MNINKPHFSCLDCSYQPDNEIGSLNKQILMLGKHVNKEHKKKLKLYISMFRIPFTAYIKAIYLIWHGVDVELIIETKYV